jgi:hypothetical protein
MSTQAQAHKVVFKVIDIMDGPHRGWILRLRLHSGEAPTIKEIKGARMTMRSAEGGAREVVVRSFPTFGGKPSDDRVARSGRLDVSVDPADSEEEAPSVVERWELAGPL